MMRHLHTIVSAYAILFALSFLTVLGVSTSLFADDQPVLQKLTPKSPEVVAALDKMCAFLSEHYKEEDRAGGMALASLAYYKYTGEKHHQMYADTINAIKEKAAKDPKNGGLDIYETGLSLIFLVEYDPVGNKNLIDAIYKSLLDRQKPHGGWGYPYNTTGDTSQTQYGVLSTWTLLKARQPVNMQSGEQAIDWILKTQDPKGCFGYQGVVAEKIGQPVEQSQTGLCMTAAAMGCLYILSDVLNIGRAAPVDNALQDALKPVDQNKDAQRNYRSTTSPKAVADVKKKGNEWFDKNFAVEYASWPYYYYYAVERYESFREVMDGTTIDPSPYWYNAIANRILNSMSSNGAVSDGCKTVCATSFAALFLMRSTKRAIEKERYLGGGELIGGKGFPTDMTRSTVRNGKVVSKRAPTTAEEMLEALKDPDSEALEAAVDSLDEMPPELAKAIMSETAKQIQKLVSDPKPERRMAAVKALGKSGELDNVPVLLYALTDPDETVVLAARDSLCTIARKLNGGYGPMEGFDELQRDKAIAKWKAWFKSIRPAAELE